MFICDSRLHCDFSLGVRMSLPQRMLEIWFMDAWKLSLPKVRPGQEVGYVICNTGRSCYKCCKIRWRFISKSHCLVGIDTFQLATYWTSCTAKISNTFCEIQHSKSLTGATLLAERARDPHDLEMDRCSMYRHFDGFLPCGCDHAENTMSYFTKDKNLTLDVQWYKKQQANFWRFLQSDSLWSSLSCAKYPGASTHHSNSCCGGGHKPW